MKSQRQKTKSAENRLTHDEKLQVMKWFVELKSNYQIADLIQEEFKKDISPQAVWCYRNSKKWRPIIKRLRERFERNFIKIPCANKADRLRFLQKVIDEGFKWSLKSVNKFGDPIYELKIGEVVKAVKEAKIEMEGYEPLVKIEQHTHFHITQLVKDVVNGRKKEIRRGDSLKSRELLSQNSES